MRSDESLRILFICLGNICRSPLAEAVFRDLVTQAGLADRIRVDSAGTGDYHIGELADPRTREVAARRGVLMTGRARQLTEADLTRFDYLIAMDTANRTASMRLGRRAGKEVEVLLLRSFDPEPAGELDVPDPYYGGAEGFERVHDIVDRSCRGLLEFLRSEHDL